MVAVSPRRHAALGRALRRASWDLALALADEALREGSVPSLARVGQLGQLGHVPTFIARLAAHLSNPGRSTPLAPIVAEHGRERETLGFGPHEIVTELLLLRRVLERFALESDAPPAAVEAIDRMMTECVSAYVNGATAELARQARHDGLTGLLTHQALSDGLELELGRARRYRYALALIFLDVDRFKAINDTRGHPEGDRVLRCVARILRETLRASDLAGRMGGDEFAVCLIGGDSEAAGRFLSRLNDRLDELAAGGELPIEFAVSAGVAHFPGEAADPASLFQIADGRLYERKRRRAA
jgi:diguanylate cyclase (GGDEF)-like protein